ncbi:MAG TPA: aldolase/citrate lyase family protein [Vitreimonas sp.]|nr:aldolase/citrate lyase family protein [Vitreimonas sp.]
MILPANSLRARALSGETLVGAFVSLGSAASAELVGRAGLDWAIVDLEHGSGSESELLGQLHALEAAGTTPLVRPQSAERLRIGRALDHGAAGLMIPRLDTAAEVREALSWMRFPPAGARGVALLTRGAGAGAVAHGDVAGLNDPILGVFQVESPRAVENASEIAAIEGVDVLFVGPADLSHGMGMPGAFDAPAYREALGSVVAACRAAGKSPGILLRSPAELEEYVALGFRFLGLGSDAGWIVDGGRVAAAAAQAAQARTGDPVTSG